MRYWWVSQNSTFKHEVPGGYLWAPKLNKVGRKNPNWEYMREIKPSDVVFSFADKKIRAVGIATSEAYQAAKPRVFGASGANWNEDGWQVDVIFRLLDNPLEPREYIDAIRPLLPARHTPLTKSGTGAQAYLFSIGPELGKLLMQLTDAYLPNVEIGRLEDLEFDQEEQEIALSDSISETMKVTLIKARRGQGLFRDRVRTIERACRVTGVDAESLLIASHIKPWSGSDPQERLDGNNGLFLSPHVDKLFDKGLISFERNGSMLVSPQLDQHVLKKWSIDSTKKFGRFNGDQAYFLEYHNETVFKPSAA